MTLNINAIAEHHRYLHYFIYILQMIFTGFWNLADNYSACVLVPIFNTTAGDSSVFACQWYKTVFGAPCWSNREVILLSSSSMKPSSTDSLSISSLSASVGRNTWSWGRSGLTAAATAGRSLQVGRHGFPLTDKGSPWDEEVWSCIPEACRSLISAPRAGWYEWRLTGLGLDLSWIAWQKWM